MRVPFCICLLVLLASLVAGQAPYTRRTPRRGGRCVGPPLAGPCLAVIPKWFYNAETKDCEQFTYGGCGGNPRNRFDSKADCQRICVPNSTPTEGECSGVENDGGIICEFPLRRWFYDPGTKACQECVYCGCQGGNKYFQTRQACEAKCVLTASPSPQPIPSPSPSVDVCQLKPDPGPCKGYGLRWYFYKGSGRCERFVYGLCQGNGNNFKTLNECQKACRKDCAYATCFANPCDVTQCEGYPEAECVANYCDGCSADFYVEQRRVQCGPPPSPAGQCIKETGTCRQQNALFGTTAPDNGKPTPCCKGTTCCVCPPGNIPVDYEPPEDPTGTCEKTCICPP